MRKLRIITLLVVAGVTRTAVAQHAQVHPAPRLVFPAQTDSNSPTFWLQGQLVMYNSTGDGPIRSNGPKQSQMGQSQPVVLGPSIHTPYWIESAWLDADGSVFAWYHHEPSNLCPGSRLTAPKIGALVSNDGGKSFIDLGIVIESAFPLDCTAQNGYFGGGNGDFTVVLGRARKYFYFFFSNYAGPLEEQGIAVARLPFDRRNNPFGAVQKYYRGRWLEPGIGGHATAIFPAKVSWARADTDAFWGSSVHWNSYLNKFVMLLNHSCCTAWWPQEGVYVSFNGDASNPKGWSTPVKLLGTNEYARWYPQVLGNGPQGTDSFSGDSARLYMYGVSDWQIDFIR